MLGLADLLEALELYAPLAPFEAVGEGFTITPTVQVARNGHKVRFTVGRYSVACPDTEAAVTSMAAKFRRLVGKTPSQILKAIGLPRDTPPHALRPIRSQAEALSVWRSDLDFDGLADAHASGWPGVHRLAMQAGAEGYLVGPTLAPPFADLAKGHPLTRQAGKVIELPAQLLHVPSGYKVGPASTALTPHLREQIDRCKT